MPRKKAQMYLGLTQPAAQTVKYEIVEKMTTQTRELQDLLENSNELEKKIMRKEETLTEKRQALL